VPHLVARVIHDRLRCETSSALNLKRNCHAAICAILPSGMRVRKVLLARDQVAYDITECERHAAA
jgi:hypothetical protein